MLKRILRWAMLFGGRGSAVTILLAPLFGALVVAGPAAAQMRMAQNDGGTLYARPQSSPAADIGRAQRSLLLSALQPGGGSSPVVSSVLAADETWIATGHDDGTIRL